MHLGNYVLRRIRLEEQLVGLVGTHAVEYVDNSKDREDAGNNMAEWVVTAYVAVVVAVAAAVGEVKPELGSTVQVDSQPHYCSRYFRALFLHFVH